MLNMDKRLEERSIPHLRRPLLGLICVQHPGVAGILLSNNWLNLKRHLPSHITVCGPVSPPILAVRHHHRFIQLSETRAVLMVNVEEKRSSLWDKRTSVTTFTPSLLRGNSSWRMMRGTK